MFDIDGGQDIMEERKSYWQQIDYTLLFLLFLLMCISLIAVYSGSGQYFPSNPTYFVERQVIWFIAGLILMVAVMTIDYELLRSFSIPLYVIGIILLLWVHFGGMVKNGSRRWIDLGFF